MRSLLIALALLLTAPAALAQSQLREITVENVCNQPIRVLLRPAVAPQDWRSYAWYTIQPGAAPTTLTYQGWRISHLPDHSFFYYGEGTVNRMVWEGNEHFANWQGVRYGLRRANLTMQNGRLNLRLSCS